MLEQLKDPEKLEIPSDPGECDLIAKHWESFGFGSHQIHWDNQGRSPANEGEVRENRLSRNIRQRIWKIWKRSTLDELAYKIVCDAAKDLALANNQRKFALLMAEAFDENISALSASASSAQKKDEEEAKAAPEEVSASATPMEESASVSAPLDLENSISTTPMVEPESVSIAPLFPSTSSFTVDEDLSQLGAAAASSELRMEIFTPEEMATMPTRSESSVEANETRRVRFVDPNFGGSDDRDHQEEMDEEEYENRISRTPNKIYPPRDMKGKRPRFSYPEEGVRVSTSEDPKIPIEPIIVPPLPEARIPAAVVGKFKREKKRVSIRGKTLKEKREAKKKVVRMSLKQINQEMQKIRDELNERESELRERKQAQVALRLRKERIERLENSQSPLYNLF